MNISLNLAIPASPVHHWQIIDLNLTLTSQHRCFNLWFDHDGTSLNSFILPVVSRHLVSIR